MITVFGIRQVESSINADIDAVDLTGPAAVHANWVEMGDSSRSSRGTCERGGKLCQAGRYGKKWAAKLDISTRGPASREPDEYGVCLRSYGGRLGRWWLRR
jgi:hypothetical protein